MRHALSRTTPAGTGGIVLQISPNVILCLAALVALQLVPMVGTAAALGFIACGMAFVFRRHKAVAGEVRDQPLLWLMVAWCVISILWSDYPDRSLRHGLQLVVTVLFAAAVASRMTPLEVLKTTTVCFLLACAASLASGRARADGEGFLGIYNSKNAMASASSMLVLAGLCLAVDRRLPGRWRVLGVASLGLGGLLLYRANSVGTAVATAAVCMALMVVLALRHLSREQRLVTGVLAILGFIALLLGMLSQIDMIAAMFLDATGKDLSLTGRTDLWELAVDQIAHRPLLGAGFQAVWVPGNPLAEMLWTEFGVESRSGFHFHNAYLSNAVEIGVVGVAMQIVLVVGGLIGAVAWVMRDARAETLFLALFMVRQVVLSMVEVPFFQQFDIGTILTVAVLVYVRRARAGSGSLAVAGRLPTHG